MASGTSALVLLVGGAAAGIATVTGKEEAVRIVTAVGQPAAAQPAESEPGHAPAGRSTAPARVDPVEAFVPRTSDEADRTAPRNPHRAGAAPIPPSRAADPAVPPPSPAPTPPVLTTRTEVETREIPFETRLVRDPALPPGTRRIESPGVPGQETRRYLVTLTDGQPTDRRLIDAVVTRQPQHRIVAVSNRPGPARHRGCRQSLHLCVPLGRSAVCPAVDPPPAEAEQAVQLVGSVDITEQDVEPLDPNDLGDLEELTC